MGLFQLTFPVIAFCTALSCGGIQIAVSRFVAETKSKSSQFGVLISGLILSMVLSFGTLLFVFHFSQEIADNIIHNTASSELIKYSVLTLPMIALHACVSGYYLGLKKTAVPAWSMMVEQSVKILSLYVLGTIWLSEHHPITPMLAVYSTILSELAGMLFCLVAMGFEKTYRLHPSTIMHSIKNLFSVSYLLTLNRLSLTFLQCVEAIQLPLALEQYGMTQYQALALYGILTGMALPVVTFPSAINNSISTMLLPSVAESNVDGNAEAVRKTTEKSIRFSSVSGIFGIGLFLSFGNFIGSDIFGHPQAGTYILILSWLCPFLYLSISFGSILHGLGKTTAAFIHNTIGIVLRLFAIWWGVPRFGINAYLLGLLFSNLVTTFLHGIYLHKFVPYRFLAVTNIIKPTIQTVISLATGFLVQYIFRYSAYTGRFYYFGTIGLRLCIICGVFAWFIFRDFKASTV
jgi:stage V sporulation protein B